MPGTLEHVFTIAEDSQGNIWFGDRDAGIWKYDGVKMTNYTKKNGLINEFALSIFEDKKGELFEENGIKYWAGDEKEILEKFWKAISHANRFVTFNGRGFDCPVLMLRSAMLKVKPSNNLMPYRYSTDQHIDLLEQLTFYSATRKFNLDFYCKSFGIESPKAGGVTGHDVAPLYKAGEYEKIARYCAGDLSATRELYLRWRDFISFSK